MENRQLENEIATDEQLLARYIEGRDERAFTVLVNRHSEMVMATARRVLSNTEDAKDAFQTTFFALAKAADKLRVRSSVAPWLHRTATRCSLLLLRSDNRYSEKAKRMTEQLKAANVDGNTIDDPSLRMANEDLEAILDEEISKLPNLLQSAIVLCDLEGMTRKNAAKELGIPLPTVTHYVTKARKLLGERLVRRGVTTSMSALAAYFSSSLGTDATVGAQLIGETTSKALIFAAGKGASDVGVSSVVFNTANEVVSTMIKAKTVAIGTAALAIVMFMGIVAGTVGLRESTARAGYIFQENFSDGNISDGTPVTWTPLPGVINGRYDASSKKLVMSPNPDEPLDGLLVGAFDERFTNGSARVSMQLSPNDNLAASVMLRATSQGEGIGGYSAAIAYNEAIGGSLFIIGRFDGEGAGDATFLAGPVFLGHDVRNEETTVQFDIFDDELTAWVWPTSLGDEGMPSEPTVSVNDSMIGGPGHVFIGTSTGDGSLLPQDAFANFSYVALGDMPIHEIPEPATAILSAIGFLCLVTCRRNYHISRGSI